MSERLQISVTDHVAHVQLNRPDKLNAVDKAMFDELGTAGEQVAAESGVRAVVLSGAGDNFCSGIDVSLFGGSEPVVDAASLAPLYGRIANRFQNAVIAWRQCPVPVICAIRGVAYGAGLQIALGADIRYARPDSRLSIMEIRWGITPDLGLTVTARGVVRQDHLRDLA